MPIMAIYRSDDVTPEEYASFRAQLPLRAAPEGALVHAHAQEGLGFITVEIWEGSPPQH